jgi:hypothetical protein
MAKLVDLKRTSAERKADRERFDKPSSGDDYGYGLRVRLDHSHLKKLGITELPKAGDHLHVHAKAHVSSVGSHSSEGRDDRHIELELRHMAVSATKKASEQDVQEGKLKGAKAAMDQALDKQEGEKEDD